VNKEAPMTGCAEALAVAGAVANRRIRAVEIVRQRLADIGQRNAAFNCFTALTEERALREAEAVDARIMGGREPGPLAGVPYAVKNLFDIAGLTTLAGAKINRERAPAAEDAVLIRHLQEAGAVLLGALNMDEYAYGFTTENAHFGATRNPHDPERTAGGSSGGSAAAVAARLVPLALGTDTNGSIRVPAALCGIFGLKPTYGRLSRAGAYPWVNSLDHAGLLATDTADLAAAYDALEGCDRSDPACAIRASEPATPELDRGLGNLRVAVAGDYFAEGGTEEAHQAVAIAAKALGARREIVIPEAARARAAAYIITASEGAALHLSALKTRPGDFDPKNRDRLLAGALIPSAWYIQVQRFRRWFRDRIHDLFREADIILTPATPCPAPLLGQETLTIGGRQVPTRAALGLYTQAISFIGLPVLAAPIFAPGTLPLGIQIIAAPWREADAFRVARVLENEGMAVAHRPAGV
jgi:AtzE family amidohydrolase